MPGKISISKDSGETVNSNVVSVFMIPDTQKRYLISTENTVDPHGLTILHVSEVVDGSLQKIATDEEWSSIKTIMRAIISGNVGSYQYLDTIDSVKASGQYSRDISVSASAAKQMSDNYGARDVNKGGSTPEAKAEEVSEAEVVPGISVVEEPKEGAVSTPVETEEVSEAVQDVAAPVVEAPVVEATPAPASEEENEESVEETMAEEVPVAEPTPAPVVEAEPVAGTEEVTIPEPVAPQPVEEVAPVAEPAPVEEKPVVVESHMVGSSPVTLPIDEPTVQTTEPVTFVAQADLSPVETPVAVPTAQIAQEAFVNPTMGIKFDISPSFAPNASLEEVVLASQEMFMEGVKNLVQTIQEKVYREMYNKEAELKAKEEMLNQREKMLNEQMINAMANFANMPGKGQEVPVKVDAE